MKVGVMGTGGIGGYFGGLLARAGGDIHFIARGKHRQVILEEGLQVVSGQGTFCVQTHVTSDPDEIGPVDLLLFAVKSYDTVEAAQFIAPMVEDESVILSLQNGIDNVQKLSAIYGEERILAGTAYVEASIAAPGVIAHRGKRGRIVFGELSEPCSNRADRLLERFRKVGIDADLSENITEILWSKFLFICGVHGVSTLSRAPLGLVLNSPETRELVIGVMREVEAVAHCKGVNLPKQAVANAIQLAESYNKKFKCSMLHDLEWRRPMEIEALNGMVVKLGKECGVPTPFNQAIYGSLRLQNERILNPFFLEELDDME